MKKSLGLTHDVSSNTKIHETEVSINEHAKHETPWENWQEILFRFFFVFLSLLSMFAYNPVMQVLNIGFTRAGRFFAHLIPVVAWLDNHLYHLGYLPQEHSIYFNDTHFGVILTITFFAVALIATAIWTDLDNSRLNYNRFYYWFCNYLAYYIFLAMLPYAVQKIIPIQATYPTAPELLSRWGDLRNWEVLFRFMGTSPAYCMFCGWFEFIASILILFNRTRIFGGLLMIVALVQVLCLNIFYNNNIILLSSILLLGTIFIIARALPKLYKIFIQLKPVSLAQRQYRFTTAWKKYVMILICFLPVWRCLTLTTKSWKYYKGYVRNEERQRLYNVSVYQQENDTIPPLTKDTTRWKYVCFLDFSPSNKQLIKFDMQERMIKYPCKWDSAKSTISFGEPNDTTDKKMFSYTTLLNGDMQLKGIWNGKNTTMQLTNVPIDSMLLVKDKFLFMQEDQ